jgi:hypothetical protein
MAQHDQRSGGRARREGRGRHLARLAICASGGAMGVVQERQKAAAATTSPLPQRRSPRPRVCSRRATAGVEFGGTVAKYLAEQMEIADPSCLREYGERVRRGRSRPGGRQPRQAGQQRMRGPDLHRERLVGAGPGEHLQQHLRQVACCSPVVGRSTATRPAGRTNLSRTWPGGSPAGLQSMVARSSRTRIRAL